MTFHTLLKLHHRIKSRKLKLLGLLLASRIGLRHLSVRIDPALSCNLACRMCYFSSSEYRRQHYGTMPENEFENIARVLFPRAFELVVGCGAEPTKHGSYRELFRLARKYHVPNVSLVTNAQLIDKNELQNLQELGMNEIVLSVHGVKKETYEHFMAGASYAKLHEVLGTLRKLRQENPFPKVRINYTVNPENLEELNAFFETFGQYNIDTLQVRPIMDLGGKYRTPFPDEQLPAYHAVITKLKEECLRHDVTLLANTMDASYKTENPDADLAELVYTYISPNTANQLGIKWETCWFRDFRRADQWTSRLVRSFWKKGKGDGWLGRSMKYDVQ